MLEERFEGLACSRRIAVGARKIVALCPHLVANAPVRLDGRLHAASIETPAETVASLGIDERGNQNGSRFVVLRTSVGQPGSNLFLLVVHPRLVVGTDPRLPLAVERAALLDAQFIDGSIGHGRGLDLGPAHLPRKLPNVPRRLRRHEELRPLPLAGQRHVGRRLPPVMRCAAGRSGRASCPGPCRSSRHSRAGTR